MSNLYLAIVQIKIQESFEDWWRLTLQISKLTRIRSRSAVPNIKVQQYVKQSLWSV